MRRVVYILLLLLIANVSLAQGLDKDSVYTYVHRPPQAGYDVNKYLVKNIRYPESISDNSLQSKVIARFVVRYTGIIDSVIVESKGNKELDNEIIRVIKAMPAWKPAVFEGKAVSAMYTLPVYLHPEQ